MYALERSFIVVLWAVRTQVRGAEGVGSLNHGRNVGDVMRQEGLGRRAALAVLREVSGARKPRLLREDAEDSHESGAERTGGLDEQEGDADVAAEGVGVLPIALSDVGGALVRSYLSSEGLPICLRPKTSLRRFSFSCFVYRAGIPVRFRFRYRPVRSRHLYLYQVLVQYCASRCTGTGMRVVSGRVRRPAKPTARHILKRPRPARRHVYVYVARRSCTPAAVGPPARRA